MCGYPEHLLPLAHEVAHGSIWLGFDLISASGAEGRGGGRVGRGGVGGLGWEDVRSACLSGLDGCCPPRLSLSEKFWLCATSGARLKEKCCLWAISSLSTALTVSMTCRGGRVRNVSQAVGETVEGRKEGRRGFCSEKTTGKEQKATVDRSHVVSAARK